MGFFRQTSRTLWYVNKMDKMAQAGDDHLAWLDQQMAKRNGDAKLRATIIADYDRRLANRAKKAKGDETREHCQICGRHIQANTGKIAHHGYQRPGQGWQTASCFGALYRSYEVACDAIQPYIDMVTRHRANLEEGLKGYFEDPPEELTVTVKLRPYQAVKYQRPEKFDPVLCSQRSDRYPESKYEREWRSRVYQNRYGIESATAEIDRMTKRLAEWKPPTTTTEGATK